MSPVALTEAHPDGQDTVKGDDWRKRAECRKAKYDPELWFPIGDSIWTRLQEEEAKKICRKCPVMVECLAWALDKRHEDGVWGGLSEKERRVIARQQPLTHLTPGGTK